MGAETAIAALKEGAIDDVLKTNLKRLASATKRALREVAARDAHQTSEARFRDLIEYAPHEILVLHQTSRIEIANAQAETLFGQPHNQLMGANVGGLIAQTFSDWPDLFDDHAGHIDATTFETTGQRANGDIFFAEIRVSPSRSKDGQWISSVIRDLTERKLQEEKLARIRRILTIFGSINSVMLRVRDKQKLLDEACRIAFQDGQFAGAAIGLVDVATGRLMPAAWSGIDADMFDFILISSGTSDVSELDVAEFIEGALSASLNEPYSIGEHSLRLSVCAGISIFPNSAKKFRRRCVVSY